MFVDETLPLKIKTFIETYCIQSQGHYRGKAVQLIPWQWDQIIKPLWGTYSEPGIHQYNESSIWIPKKKW